MERLTAQNSDGRFVPRSGAEFAGLFRGLEFVPPGPASVARWHAPASPAGASLPAVADVGCNGLVARVP